MRDSIRSRSVRLARMLAVVASAAMAAVSMPATQGQPSPKTAHHKASEAAIRLWVPAYFYPFGPGLREWDHLIASARLVPIVAIVNPASGPGNHIDTNFAAVLPRARKAGITLVGYVATQYGRKPLDQVQRECETYLSFYPDIRGFHFDEQSSRAEDVDYYAHLYRYVHRRIPNGLVLTNPGTICDRAYAARPASDVISLFENERGIDRFQPPAWAGAFPGSRFCVQAHAVAGSDAMRRAVDRANRLKVGYLFITDDVLPNPYDRLPSYWDDEVDAVREVNRAASKH